MKSAPLNSKASKAKSRGDRDVLLRFRRFLADLRHDPKALLELRQLFLVLMIVGGLCYAIYALLIEPTTQELAKKQARRQELSAQLAGDRLEQMITTQTQQLFTQKKQLQEELQALLAQKLELRRQFAEISGEVAFANAVLGLRADSPVNLDGTIAEMLVMEPVSSDGFDVFPVAMRGKGVFGDFLAYLHYVEECPEVGIVTDVRLEQGTEPSFPDSVPVKFDLILGRVQLQ